MISSRVVSVLPPPTPVPTAISASARLELEAAGLHEQGVGVELANGRPRHKGIKPQRETQPVG
jgi:hypothetical protein